MSAQAEAEQLVALDRWRAAIIHCRYQYVPEAELRAYRSLHVRLHGVAAGLEPGL